MGVPTGGTNLGQATGTIVINTGQLQQAVRQVQSASQLMTQALGAIGISASIRQFADFVIQADAIATSFRRQSVAARELAGSQSNLNQLLEVYDRATGGVIDRAQALSDVTRLMAVGFADSAEELDTFVRAVRGISLATGRPQEFIVTQLQLELLNQTGFRLDQIGLGMEEVRRKAEELRAANTNLTQQQAYQSAVLETANAKFGNLTRSVEAQATGIEKLRKAWADFTLETGQNARPAINAFAEGATQELKGLSDTINGLIRDITNLRLAMDELEKRNQQRQQELGITETGITDNFFTADPIGDFADRADRAISDWLARLAGQMTEFERIFVQSSVGRDVGRHRGGARANVVVDAGFTEEQTAAIREWAASVQEIERQAARDRIEATRQYESQRSQVIRDYERTIAREAQDFALQRQRSEQDYAISLQRIHRDIARREVRQAEDLERTLADARADANERAADRLADLEERIAETRADSRERIAELEEDFNRRRERAQRDHQERLRDAAAALDAVRVRELQRDFRNSRRDAQEDLDERIEAERENEAERLADLQKAHERQTREEQEQLEERIAQAREAHQRQLDDAREADEQRLADMSADMVLRRAREDEDRAIRLQRLAEDHQAQLEELARQHEERMLQITLQEQEELAAVNEAFDEQMASLHIYHAGVLEAQEAHQKESLKLYQQYLDAQEAELRRRTMVVAAPGTSPGYSPISGPFPSTTPVASSVTTNARTSSVVVQTGAIQIISAPGMNEQAVGDYVLERMAEFLEDYANS